MANNQPLRGSSAVLQLATNPNPAGTLGGQIFNDEYNIATVGRVTGVEIRVTTDLEVFHEIGTREPQDVVPGNINISGRVDRAFINGALLRLLMGRLGGAGNNEDNFPLELQPVFNMILDTTDIRQPGTVGTRLTVSQVRFDDWAVVVPEDDFIMENVTFKATKIEREEKQ
jgi:hypothetical protein